MALSAIKVAASLTILLLLLLLLLEPAQAFFSCPSRSPLSALLRRRVALAAATTPIHSPSSFQMVRRPGEEGQDPTLTISLADGRTFVLRDVCPPTNHSLLQAQVDPAILAVQDPVFGTRFDLRTGKVRGAWCPDSWWVRRLFPPSSLSVLLDTTIKEKGVAGRKHK